MTPPEVRLWALLRRSPGGVSFRRQHPIGPYVTDFYCAAAKRVSEIDKSANTFVETYQEGVDAIGRPAMVKMYKKKGLTDEQTHELSDTNATCDKIPPALTELAKGLAAEDKTFDPFTEEASRIRRESDRLLDTDYLQTYRQLPK